MYYTKQKNSGCTKKHKRVNTKIKKKHQLIETYLKIPKLLELAEKIEKNAQVPLLSCTHYRNHLHWSVWVYEVCLKTCSMLHSQCWSQDLNPEIFFHCEVALLIISIIISD